MATVTEVVLSDAGHDVAPAKRLAWYEATYAVVLVTPRYGWVPQSPKDVPPVDAREADLTAETAQAIARRFNSRQMFGGQDVDRWAVVIPIDVAACERPASAIDSGACEEGGCGMIAKTKLQKRKKSVRIPAGQLAVRITEGGKSRIVTMRDPRISFCESYRKFSPDAVCYPIVKGGAK